MGKSVRLVLCLSSLVSLASLAPVSASSGDIDLRVRPLVGRAPAYVSATIHVSAAADNRLLRVTLDSEGFYRSSDVQLDGDRAPVQHSLVWRDVSAGTYDVIVELYGSNGRKQTVRRQLFVVGFEP